MPLPTANESTATRAWGGNAAWTLLVMAVVFGIACLHYQGQTLARGPDQADILLSFFFDASQAIREEGLWAAMYTPGLQAGIPNWSNPNFNPLYPLYFNWAGSDATVFDTLDRLNLIIHLHLAILAGAGFYLARTLGVRLLPALCAGLVLPWFPAIRSAAAWPQIIAGLAWVAWVIAFQAKVYLADDRRGALAGFCGLAVAATLLVYAQPAQNLVFAVFASAIVWLLVGAQVLAQGDRNARDRFFSATGWMMLAGLFVAAATGSYLLEVLHFHEHSIRWLGAYGGYVVGDQPVPVGALRFHALAAADDLGLLAAFEYRKGIGNAYLGAALAVAMLSLLEPSTTHSPRRQVTRALTACALLALLFCFSFMAPLISTIPIVNKVRELTWWSCLAIVLMVPLAAAGLQDLFARAGAKGRGVRDPWMWVFVCAFALALAATLGADTPYRMEASIVLALGFVALAWPLIAGSRQARMQDVACVAVLVCAVWIPFRHNIEFDRSDATLFLPDRMQARADAARLRAWLPDEDQFRIALHPALPEAQLLVHAYANLGFRAIRGGIGPLNHPEHQLLSMPNPAVSALYGVKYTLLPASASAPGDRPLGSGVVLRTDTAALPRLFFVAGGLRVADDPVAALRALTAATPAHAFVAQRDLPDAFDIAAYASGKPRIAPVHVTENRRTYLEATFDSDRSGLLVLNEDPEARWRARVDGKPVLPFRLNGFQTAFPVPAAGRHVVQIERPGRLFGGRLSRPAQASKRRARPPVTAD